MSGLTDQNSGWGKLDFHRRQAANYPLAILVWGPSDDGSTEYLCRCQIRDDLRNAGHDVHFSEDLANHSNALSDPIDDEILQAEAADIIVLIYGSRGTQTEHDVILTEERIATKSIIIIEEGIEDTLRNRALASESWRKTSQYARRVITYKKSKLVLSVPQLVMDVCQNARAAAYVRSLRNGRIFN